MKHIKLFEDDSVAHTPSAAEKFLRAIEKTYNRNADDETITWGELKGLLQIVINDEEDSATEGGD